MREGHIRLVELSQFSKFLQSQTPCTNIVCDMRNCLNVYTQLHQQCSVAVELYA